MKLSRHPFESQDPARRICGAYELHDTWTRFWIPAFAGMTVFIWSQVVQADPLISKKDCKYLVSAVPAPGVEYQPGVDVHGKPVVEADITPPVVQMPDHFSFDINIDAAQAAGLPVPAGTQALAKVGTVTYDKGQLSFNGTPLEGEQEAQLKALCAVPEKPSK